MEEKSAKAHEPQEHAEAGRFVFLPPSSSSALNANVNRKIYAHLPHQVAQVRDRRIVRERLQHQVFHDGASVLLPHVR
jgi:hypothetical protein